MNAFKRNILTVDVEDYFHVSAFERQVAKSSWASFESRVKGNTMRILDMFDEAGVKATFFVLGWVAERDPGLVREIGDRGHEVACHGHLHRRVHAMKPEEFREDVRKAKAKIEDAGGRAVKGFRSPSFSVTPGTFWCLDVLLEEGFAYDSSVFPIRHDHYGIPLFSRFPVRFQTPGGGEIVEFPLSTVRWLGRNFPVAGGGFLRFLPLSLIRGGIRRINDMEGKPAVIYFHPWEIDPDQPRVKGASLLARFRHYRNLDKTEGKVRSLLSEFSFAPVWSWLGQEWPRFSYES